MPKTLKDMRIKARRTKGGYCRKRRRASSAA